MKKKIMSPVGFEPTRLATSVLKTDPLDHSGTVTSKIWTGNKSPKNSSNRDRTDDIMINSHALYQLSYRGIDAQPLVGTSKRELPRGFEPRSAVSKTAVITSYTIEANKMLTARLELAAFGS